eukprot:767309-Hanusia_phi.AAC.10
MRKLTTTCQGEEAQPKGKCKKFLQPSPELFCLCRVGAQQAVVFLSSDLSPSISMNCLPGMQTSNPVVMPLWRLVHSDACVWITQPSPSRPSLKSFHSQQELQAEVTPTRLISRIPSFSRAAPSLERPPVLPLALEIGLDCVLVDLRTSLPAPVRAWPLAMVRFVRLPRIAIHRLHDGLLLIERVEGRDEDEAVEDSMRV